MSVDKEIFNSHADTRSSENYRNDIQGLRAIAVLGVILFHFNRNILPGGFIGVDIFFVISGFLVGGIVLRQKEKRNFSFVNFYFARIRRIVPAYFVMLAVVSLTAAILLIPPDFNLYWKSAKSAAYFASNQYFSGFGDYFAPSAHELPLLHTWSLAIEMQFYLLLPALLIILPKRWIKAVLLIAIVALSVFGFQETMEGSKKTAYFSLLVRIPEFLIGVLLTFSSKSKSDEKSFFNKYRLIVQIIGLALISYSFFAIQEDSNFPGLLFTFPCLGTALIIAAKGGKLSSILSSDSLVFIGKLSYSLYLWHWPILAFFRYVTGHYELDIIQSVLAGMMLIAASYSSLRWIETPFRQKNWLAKSRLLRTSALLLAICLPLSLVTRVNAAVEPPLPIALTRYADASTICHGSVIGDCIRGALSSSSSPILVLGDSHAAQLNLFFDQVGVRNSQRFRVISASNCVTIPGFDIERIPDYSRANCASTIKYASNFIPSSPVIVIAGMWQYQMQSQKFADALDAFLTESNKAGKTVFILWQVPMLSSDVLRLRRIENLGLPSKISIHSDWLAANRAVANIASRHPNTRFLDFSKEELFATPPLYHGTLIYHDSHHLNEIGAVKYAEVAFGSFVTNH